MKKYKVVISDLHLGRGRTLEGGATNSLEEFYFGKKLIEFFNYYCSGEFRDAEVECVINGDFLNFLGIALLAGLTLVGFVSLSIVYFKQKDFKFAIISLLEVLTLCLAASGIIGGGAH